MNKKHAKFIPIIIIAVIGLYFIGGGKLLSIFPGFPAFPLSGPNNVYTGGALGFMYYNVGYYSNATVYNYTLLQSVQTGTGSVNNPTTIWEVTFNYYVPVNINSTSADNLAIRLNNQNYNRSINNACSTWTTSQSFVNLVMPTCINATGSVNGVGAYKLLNGYVSVPVLLQTSSMLNTYITQHIPGTYGSSCSGSPCSTIQNVASVTLAANSTYLLQGNPLTGGTPPIKYTWYQQVNGAYVQISTNQNTTITSGPSGTSTNYQLKGCDSASTPQCLTRQPIAIISSGTTVTPPPPDPWTTFTTLLASINTQVTSFLSTLLSNILKYFSIPSFSIGVVGINATNVSQVSRPINVTVSETIPSSYLSTKWNIALTTAQTTSCVSYVYQNSTKIYVYQSPIYNASASPYNNNFTYTPSATGIYIIGATCLNSYTNWLNNHWSVWSTPAAVANTTQTKAILVVASTTAPPPNVCLSTSSCIFNSITTYLQNLYDSVYDYFESLGIVANDGAV